MPRLLASRREGATYYIGLLRTLDHTPIAVLLGSPQALRAYPYLSKNRFLEPNEEARLGEQTLQDFQDTCAFPEGEKVHRKDYGTPAAH